MGQFRLWAFSLCAAAAGAALLQMLLPQKAQNRAATMVINLFLLLCVAAPLAQLWPLSASLAPDWEAAASEAVGPTTDQIIAGEIETRLVALVGEKLQGMGINPVSVRIDITVSQDSFSIDGVSVTAREDSDVRRAAARQLSQELGLPVNIAGEHEVTS